jgi:hypothetical protein
MVANIAAPLPTVELPGTVTVVRLHAALNPLLSKHLLADSNPGVPVTVVRNP